MNEIVLREAMFAGRPRGPDRKSAKQKRRPLQPPPALLAQKLSS